MSYVEKNEKDWTKIIGGGILAMLAVAAFKWGMPYFREQAAMSDMATAEGAERVMLEDPKAGPTLRAIKSNYPTDFDRMRDQVRAASAKRDSTAISQAVHATLGQINQRESRHLAAAPHDRVDALSRQHLAIVEHQRHLGPRISLLQPCRRPVIAVVGEELHPFLEAALVKHPRLAHEKSLDC